MNTVYTISGVRCCDHIIRAGFVTDKKDCGKLALKNYLEHVGDEDEDPPVTVDTEHDTVTILDDLGYTETYYIQTIKRLA